MFDGLKSLWQVSFNLSWKQLLVHLCTPFLVFLGNTIVFIWASLGEMIDFGGLSAFSLNKQNVIAQQQRRQQQLQSPLISILQLSKVLQLIFVRVWTRFILGTGFGAHESRKNVQMRLITMPKFGRKDLSNLFHPVRPDQRKQFSLSKHKSIFVEKGL